MKIESIIQENIFIMKSLNLKITITSLIYIIFNLITIPNAKPFDNPEKDILSSAIKIYSSITPEENIITRLRKQELALEKIDQILELYASSDIGLEIFSTGKFGKFNIDKARKKYLDEKITYSLKTCQSSPGYSCLGFISLEKGQKLCANQNSFSDVMTASDNFKNAYQIFKKQDDIKKYELVVLSAYRDCSNSSKSSFSKDYINSRLVNILLANGDENKAVGITQNMTTPTFKLLSSIDIRSFQGKFNNETYLAIRAKAGSINDWYDRETVKYTLAIKALDEGLSIPIYSGVDTDISITRTCGAKQKYLSELAMEYAFKDAKNNPLSYSSGLTRLSPYAEANECSNYTTEPIEFFLRKIHILMSYPANILEIKGLDELETDNWIQIAEDIKKHQYNYGTDPKIQINYLTSRLSDEQLLTFFKFYNDEDPTPKLLGIKESPYPAPFNQSPNDPIRYENLTKRKRFLGSDYGKFAIFKAIVNTGDTCLASKQLFNELKGTKYESKALLYLVSSNDIKWKSCGDSDLDLLIN